MAGSSIKIKPLLPKAFDEQVLVDVMRRATGFVTKGMMEDFEATTEDWKHEVTFEPIESFRWDSRAQVYAAVFTTDEIYNYVNNGTPEHDIPKTKPGPLRFRWGGRGSYKAKTRPGFIGSMPGGPTGPWVTMRKVHHPGTEAREFDKMIKRKWVHRFERLMADAMAEIAKASRHGIP